MSDSILSLSKVGLTLEGKPVLREITWEVKRGENWAVVGPNGAGKTSLLRLLNGYLWPTSGRIKLLGESFGSVDLRELRRKIGLVSPSVTDWIQADQMVSEVVQSGKFASIGLWGTTTAADKRLAAGLLRRMGCARYINSRFGKLSQGERQKVVIARALMARPRLLALDEPCSGLDIPGREKFLSSIGAMAARMNPSILLVTHRIEEIPGGFTNAMLLKAGRIVKAGKIGEVLEAGALTKCFGVEVSVARRGDRYYAMVGS